jgi:hypothetical protein
MKRRNFLQTLLGLAGTIALPANSNIHDQQQIEPLKLLETSVAGFQYYEGGRLFNQLNIGDPLQLRRAPENKYDKRAVEVYWNNNMPGHIPKVANMSITQILDNSGKLNAEITQLRLQQKPWYCVSLTVYINNV